VLFQENDRGRKQNRTLALTHGGVDSLRGDTNRFHYDKSDVHSIQLDPEDPCKFKLACFHYYQYECETESQRYTVAEAFEALQLGEVLKGGRPAGTGTMTGSSDPPTMSDFELIKVIGRGGLGKVLKVQHNQTRRVYAMKQLKVPTLIKHKQVERARMEKAPASPNLLCRGGVLVL